MWPQRTITVDGKPYLTRYYILPGVFVHHFHSSDQFDEFHNHPWAWAFSIILKGGYVEERLTSRGITHRFYKAGSINWLTQWDFHRVDLFDMRGCWTLFFVGPRCRQWGFWNRITAQYRDWTTNPEAIK